MSDLLFTDEQMEEICQLACLAHGDSWDFDDGAKDQWGHTVSIIIDAINHVMTKGSSVDKLFETRENLNSTVVDVFYIPNGKRVGCIYMEVDGSWVYGADGNGFTTEPLHAFLSKTLTEMNSQVPYHRRCKECGAKCDEGAAVCDNCFMEGVRSRAKVED